MYCSHSYVAARKLTSTTNIKSSEASAHTYVGHLQTKNDSTSTLDRTVHTYYNKKYIEASVCKRYYEWTISTT